MSDAPSQQLTCIGCPLGCPLAVEVREGRAWQVKGYQCKRGKTYAEQEVSDPRRTLTTTVALRGGPWPRLPVRTADAVPKDQVVALCRALHRLSVEAPIQMGDVILADAAGTGVDVVATRSMAAVG